MASVKSNSKNSNKKTTKKTSTKTKKPVSKTKNSEAKITSSTNTLLLANEREIGMDFATKAYKEFNTLVKSIVLFGSAAKHTLEERSDIDIIVILDDISIKFDEELIAWYRKKLATLLNKHQYQHPLHISSVKLSSWWSDLMKGDPVVLNVLRYGDALIDFGGFFKPLQVLLKDGKIRATPEAIYTLLERAPAHMTRARGAMLAVVDGVYWSMVDSAHAALIAADVMPPSPEKIMQTLDKTFVQNKLLHPKFAKNYDIVHTLAKDIVHGKRVSIEGKYLDDLFKMSDEFLNEMSRLVEDLVKHKRK